MSACQTLAVLLVASSCVASATKKLRLKQFLSVAEGACGTIDQMEISRAPQIGDQVRLQGRMHVFEVVRVHTESETVDVKRATQDGIILRNVPWREISLLETSQPDDRKGFSEQQ